MVHSDFLKEANLGPSVLRLKVASQIIRPISLPQPKSVKTIPQKKMDQAPAKTAQETVAPSEPSSSPEMKENVRSVFKAQLRAAIEENKYYPPVSRRLGQTGTVTVAFTLLKDGNIINVRIDRPSRYDRLNQSALDAVKKVKKFRPIPKELGATKMDITVPLNFFTI